MSLRNDIYVCYLILLYHFVVNASPTTAIYTDGPTLLLPAALAICVTVPCAELPPAIVLAGLSDADAAAVVGELLESVLADAIGAGEPTDAVIAQSGEQAKALWRIREGISEAQDRKSVV